MQDIVGVLRASGEATRLRLLALLADGEHTVKDLTDILGQSQPRVSRHLKLLADAGLVERNAEGAWAYYRLAPSGVGAELARWLTERLDDTQAPLCADRLRQTELRNAQQQAAAEYFAGVARDWDRWRSLHVPEEAVEAAIVASLGGRRVKFALDLGTGTGRMLELLAAHYERGLGIDASREMLAVARARLAQAGVAHAQVRLADIIDLNASLAPADLVILHQVLHYFDDPGRMLAQASSPLAPTGEILVVDFAPHDLEFLRTEHAHRRLGLSQAQMRGWAASLGLSVIEFRDFPPSDGDGLTVCLWRLGRAG